MTVRVISLPGKSHENRFFYELLTALERRGVTIIPPSTRSLASLSFDILHINFPTHYITEYDLCRALVSSLVLGMYFLLLRITGRRIVYTVHDVVPLKVRHKLLLNFFIHCVLYLTNGYIFLSRSSRIAFEVSYPTQLKKPWVLAPHGPYPTTVMSAEKRAESRKQVVGDAPCFVIGFLGAIKPYKNVEALLDLPERTTAGLPVHVVIAGKVEKGYEADVASVIARLPHCVTRVDRRLADDELDRWIQTVDVVLLPYMKGSNSGSALLVLSNGGRLIGSNVVAFQEIGGEVGQPWVYCLSACSEGRRTYAQLVNLAASQPPDEADQVRLSAYLNKISWSSTALTVADFYSDLRSNRLLTKLEAL